MAEKSISHCQGKGSLAHNNREFRPKNVDSSRTPDNVTFVKIPIAQAYESLFGAAVERYNARQKRNDRKIHTSYYEYQFNHKVSQSVIESADKRHSFYEDVVQIGTMTDTGVGTPDARIAAECLTEYMNGFQARCPNFYVFNAVLHPYVKYTTKNIYNFLKISYKLSLLLSSAFNDLSHLFINFAFRLK